MKKSLCRYQYSDIWATMSLIHEASLKIRNRELMKYGISAEQAGILFVLAVLDHRPTIAEIARYYLREPNSTSGTVNRMVKHGLIKKDRDAERKNVWRLSLTDKGLQLYHCIRNRESLGRIMSLLSEEEEKQLASSLNKLLSKVTQELGVKSRLPMPSTRLERYL